MTEYAADDAVSIREGIARLERERSEARAFLMQREAAEKAQMRANGNFCSCGHTGRSIARNLDGYLACSACNKSVDE